MKSKYRLKKDMPELNAGAIFEWDEKIRAYAHGAPYLTDTGSIVQLSMPKGIVELSTEWFEEIKERDFEKIEKAIKGLRFSDEDIAGVYLVDKRGLKSQLIYFEQSDANIRPEQKEYRRLTPAIDRAKETADIAYKYNIAIDHVSNYIAENYPDIEIAREIIVGIAQFKKP